MKLNTKQATLLLVIEDVEVLSASFALSMDFNHRDLESLEVTGIIRVTFEGATLTPAGETLLDTAHAVLVEAAAAASEG